VGASVLVCGWRRVFTSQMGVKRNKQHLGLLAKPPLKLKTEIFASDAAVM